MTAKVGRSYLPAASASPTYRVAGVLLGRFDRVDGRRARLEWEAAAMVAAFAPGTVPLLGRHGGLPAGYLDTLRADGADLHFTATIWDYPDIYERLRVSCPISAELVSRGEKPFVGELPTVVNRHYFRGTLRDGENLVGVALEERPAAVGSVAWIVREGAGG